MTRRTKAFHALSYLQYPLVAVAVVQVLLALRAEEAARFEALNSGLVFMGLSVTMSTLQDTTTTQNELSRRVWTSPTLGPLFLGALAAMAMAFIGVGLWGLHSAGDGRLQELSLGILVLGIGVVGLLKAAAEMAAHHVQQAPSTEEVFALAPAGGVTGAPDVDEHGRLAAPHHDGHLVGVMVGRDECTVHFETRERTCHRLRLTGLRGLDVSRFREGNIILSVMIHRAEDAERLIERDLQKTLGHGTPHRFAGRFAVVIDSSYGAELVADCDGVELLEGSA